MNQKSLDKKKTKIDYSKPVEPIMTADNLIVGYKNVQNKPKSSEGKKDYSKEFENMLGNPIEQINRLITKAHTLSAKQKFIDRFGEDPVDVLGNDWENYIEEYLKEVNDEEFMIDRL